MTVTRNGPHVIQSASHKSGSMNRAPVEYIEVRSDLGRTVRVFLDGLCVCGSARLLRACCLRDGSIVERSAPSPTMPPAPPTMHANARCYARALNDCDPKVSKEHYFSRGVTRAVAGRGKSNTVRIIRGGKPDLEIPPDQAFQANVLCRRHNSALSALDVTGERLFRFLREGLVLVPAYSYRTLPGRDVERWLLKVTCGVRAAEKKDVSLEWLRMLFGYSELPAPLGLYMHAPLGQIIHGTMGVQFAVHRRAEELSGAEVILDGVRFTLDLKGDGRVLRQADLGAMRVHRPSGIWFDHAGATTLHLALEWGERPDAEQSLVIDVA